MASSTSESFSPPYPDIIKLAAEFNLNDDAKYRILTERWENVHRYNFPSRLNLYRVMIYM